MCHIHVSEHLSYECTACHVFDFRLLFHSMGFRLVLVRVRSSTKRNANNSSFCIGIWLKFYRRAGPLRIFAGG